MNSYYWTITAGDRLYLFDSNKYTPDQMREVLGRTAFSGQLCKEDLPLVTTVDNMQPIHAELIYQHGKPYIYS